MFIYELILQWVLWDDTWPKNPTSHFIYNLKAETPGFLVLLYFLKCINRFWIENVLTPEQKFIERFQLLQFVLLTILILEKLTRPSSVKLGVPSSMKARSVRYMPKYGTHGGLQLQSERCKFYSLCDWIYGLIPVQHQYLLFESFPEVFESPLWRHSLLQPVHQRLCLKIQQSGCFLCMREVEW